MSPVRELVFILFLLYNFESALSQNSDPGTSFDHLSEAGSITPPDYSLPTTPDHVPTPSESQLTDSMLVNFRLRHENYEDNDGTGSNNSAHRISAPNEITGSIDLNKRKRKRRKRGVSKPQIAEQIQVSSELAEDYPCRTICWSISPDGVKYNGIVYGREMCEDDRLHNAAECNNKNFKPWNEFIEWHKDSINKGLTLEEKEQAAIEERRKFPIRFKCAYCGHSEDYLSQLKLHVVGRQSGGKLVVGCYQRRKEEGFEGNSCRLTQRPQKFPWAKVTLRGNDLVKTVIDPATGRETFDVPNNIQSQWDRHMVDERLNDLGKRRGRKRKEVGASVKAEK